MRIDSDLSAKFDCDPIEFIRIEFDQCNDYSARRAAVMFLLNLSLYFLSTVIKKMKNIENRNCSHSIC